MTQQTIPTAKPKDSIFGICAALGEDFGFNPLWLRIAFAVALLFNLEGVIATYATLGVIVLVSRLLVRNPRPAPAPAPAVAAEEAPMEEPLRRAA